MNRGGKIDGGDSAIGGLYVSGWLKRGPSGIIGTNIMDAKDTVINILQDLDADKDPKHDASNSLADLLMQRGVPVVKWSGFQKINKEETSISRKRSERQPREKLTDIRELLKAAQVPS